MSLSIYPHKWQSKPSGGNNPNVYAANNHIKEFKGFYSATVDVGDDLLQPGFVVSSEDVLASSDQFNVSYPTEDSILAGNIFLVLVNPLQGAYNENDGGLFFPSASGGSFTTYNNGTTCPVLRWNMVSGTGIYLVCLVIQTTDEVTANSPVYPGLDGKFYLTPQVTNSPAYGIVDTTPSTTVQEETTVYVDIVAFSPFTYTAPTLKKLNKNKESKNV